MARGHLQPVVRQIRRLAGAPFSEGDDALLLDQFAACRDERAFEALVRRHGRLVRAVCRHVLRSEEDAEDAFQATFLVLARKAGAIRKRQSLASWLHGVALRAAWNARKSAMRRRRRETRPDERTAEQPVTEAALREVQAILDEEVQRLPEKLRAPFVLCCLEANTKAEAARVLNWKEGTVSGRLAQARERLRDRLTRRGVTLSAALCALAVTSETTAATPAAVVTATTRAAMRFLANGGEGQGAILAKQALQGMASGKIKATVLLMLSLLAASAIGYQLPAGGGRLEDEAKQQADEPKAESRKAKVDVFGDPLPPDALVRMGTIRLRQPNPRMLFSADGKTLTSVGAYHTVHTWDVATGKFLREKLLEGTQDLDGSAISLAPDGKTLVTWRNNRTLMAVYETATGKKLGSVRAAFRGGDDQVYRVALGPDGKAIAASTLPGKVHSIRLWDVATGTERILLEHIRHDEHLEFSPDGKLLGVLSSMDDALRLWDVQTGKLLHSLKVEAECFHFSPDGRTVVSANYDRTLKLWDVATGKEQATLRATPVHDIQCLAFSPSGKVLAAAGQRGIRLWDVAAGKVVHQLPDRMVYEMTFAPDGKVLAASGGSNIRLWDVATGKRLLFRPGHEYEASSIAVSPDGKDLASTSYSDGTLCLWEAATGRLLHQPPGAGVAGRTACFSTDGKLVASGGHDGFLHLWETATGKEWRRFPIEALKPEEGNPFVDALCLSPDGKRLAAVARYSRSSQMNVWDVATGKPMTRRPFEGHGFEFFTPDGKGITVRVPEGMAIQDAVTGKILVTFPGIVDLYPIAFSPDGRLMAVTRGKVVVPAAGKWAGFARSDGDVTALSVAEVATGKEVLTIETGESRILAFSADARLIATADRDLVRVWEIATGKEIYRRTRHEALPGVPAQAAVTSVAILRGGRALATGLMDGTILVWPLAAQTPVAKALARQELDSMWADLLSDDAGKAFRAIQSLVASQAQAIAYLKDNLHEVAEVDTKRIESLIADLDSEQFDVRQAAAKELAKVAEQIEPILRQTLEGKPSAETRKRVEALLSAPRAVPSATVLRSLRAIQALEYIGTPEAKEVLRKLAEGAASARETRDAKAALQRLQQRHPTP